MFYSSVCHEGQHVSVALVTTSLSAWICSKLYSALRGPSLWVSGRVGMMMQINPQRNCAL